MAGQDSLALVPSPPAGATAEPCPTPVELPPFREIYQRYFEFVWSSARHLGTSPESLDDIGRRVASMGWNLGETYALGDNPLVLLTALQSAYQPDASSSSYVNKAMPLLSEDGQYITNPNGRPLRVYTQLDNRLMFEDLYCKLATFAAI